MGVLLVLPQVELHNMESRASSLFVDGIREQIGPVITDFKSRGYETWFPEIEIAPNRSLVCHELAGNPESQDE